MDGIFKGLIALSLIVLSKIRHSSIAIMKPFSFLLLFPFFLFAANSTHAQVEYVDPTIGGVGILLEPTRPTDKKM